jgi:putative phosphoribosyl transferase
MTTQCTDVGVTPHAVHVPAGGVRLEGELGVPRGARGIVLFAHGSGSSRLSPRNQYVAEKIRRAGIATLLFDLMTEDEERNDMCSRVLRFQIDPLAARLLDATAWIGGRPEARDLTPGYFGSSTGGAAALVAAARLGKAIGAVVSRGGRPDLAEDSLAHVVSPTLLIVGGDDHTVLELNRQAYARLRCEKSLEVVPMATHLFVEPGALEDVAHLAARWFRRHLGAPAEA